MKVDFKNLDLAMLAPARRAEGSGDHIVEFYDDDAFVDLVGTFLSKGLEAEDAVLVVAEAGHRRRIEAALASSGLDVAGLRARGRYVSLDADEVLSRFTTEDDDLDEARGMEVLGDLVARAAEGAAGVRVFGEMVARLWERGNVADAIALESVWNRLGETLPFRLFCAYPVSAFAGDDLAFVREVCMRHSHVIPPASLAAS